MKIIRTIATALFVSSVAIFCYFNRHEVKVNFPWFIGNDAEYRLSFICVASFLLGMICATLLAFYENRMLKIKNNKDVKQVAELTKKLEQYEMERKVLKQISNGKSS